MVVYHLENPQSIIYKVQDVDEEGVQVVPQDSNILKNELRL
jgi:hypothetical protein